MRDCQVGGVEATFHCVRVVAIETALIVIKDLNVTRIVGDTSETALGRIRNWVCCATLVDFYVAFEIVGCGRAYAQRWRGVSRSYDEEEEDPNGNCKGISSEQVLKTEPINTNVR